MSLLIWFLTETKMLFQTFSLFKVPVCPSPTPTILLSPHQPVGLPACVGKCSPFSPILRSILSLFILITCTCVSPLFSFPGSYYLLPCSFQYFAPAFNLSPTCFSFHLCITQPHGLNISVNWQYNTQFISPVLISPLNCTGLYT